MGAFKTYGASSYVHQRPGKKGSGINFYVSIVDLIIDDFTTDDVKSVLELSDLNPSSVSVEDI